MNPPRKHFLHVLNPQAAVWKIQMGGAEVGLGKSFLRLRSGRPWFREQWLPWTGLEPGCDVGRVCVGMRVGSFLLRGPGWAPEAQPLRAWAGSGCVLFLCFL